MTAVYRTSDHSSGAVRYPYARSRLQTWVCRWLRGHDWHELGTVLSGPVADPVQLTIYQCSRCGTRGTTFRYEDYEQQHVVPFDERRLTHKRVSR